MTIERPPAPCSSRRASDEDDDVGGGGDFASFWKVTESFLTRSVVLGESPSPSVVLGESPSPSDVLPRAESSSCAFRSFEPFMHERSVSELPSLDPEVSLGTADDLVNLLVLSENLEYLRVVLSW